MSGCDCAEDWRLELIDLATGERVDWLAFTRFDFEELLNQVGNGTVTVPLPKTTLAKTWPHRRAIAFTRIAGPGASPSSPFCEFIGMIETASPQTSDGQVTLGVVSIEGYLDHRLMDDGTYTEAQTTLGSDAVNAVTTDGIPLTGEDGGSPTSRTIVLEAGSDTMVLPFITQLTEMDDGPDYRRIHTFTSSAWTTAIRFEDYVGDTTARKLDARRGLSAYGIEVDGAEHANFVRGRDQDQNAYEADGVSGSIYPRFDKAVKYSDVTDSDQLEALTEGELAQNKDPIAVPDVTIARLDISAVIKLGDSLDLNMDNGAIQFEGEARVVGKAWSLEQDSPTLCTLSMVPLDDVATAILDATPSNGRGCC